MITSALRTDPGVNLAAFMDELTVAQLSVEQELQAAMRDTQALQTFVETAVPTLHQQAAGRALHSVKRGVWRVHGHAGARLKLQSLQECLGLYVFADEHQLAFHCVHNGQSFRFADLAAAQQEVQRVGSAFAQWIDAGLGNYLHRHEGQVGIALQAQEDTCAYLSELYPKLIERTALELDAVYRKAMEEFEDLPSHALDSQPSVQSRAS